MNTALRTVPLDYQHAEGTISYALDGWAHIQTLREIPELPIILSLRLPVQDVTDMQPHHSYNNTITQN